MTQFAPFFLLLSFCLTLSTSVAQTDTLNRVNEAGRKVGYWKFYGKMKSNSGYADTAIYEQGWYENGRKTGVWTQYHEGGQVKSEITYVNGRPNGPYQIFYPNGNPEERGIWKKRHMIDTMWRYYENGQLKRLDVFNHLGKRHGTSLIFHENGAMAYKACHFEGKEMGWLVRYGLHGEPIDSICYQSGVAIDGDHCPCKGFSECGCALTFPSTHQKYSTWFKRPKVRSSFDAFRKPTRDYFIAPFYWGTVYEGKFMCALVTYDVHGKVSRKEYWGYHFGMWMKVVPPESASNYL